MATPLKEGVTPTHGIRSTYVNLKCRCVECTRANREYMRPYMREWKQRRRDQPEE